MTTTVLSRFTPKFPRAVDGGKFRSPLWDDAQCEALSKRMDTLYREIVLDPDDRALLLHWHERLAMAYARRADDRRDGWEEPSCVPVLAKLQRDISGFELRVRPLGEDI